MKIAEYLASKEYPGRGIMVGKTATDIVMAYFIMGRSVNSQNRIFEQTEDGIRTKAFDESKMVDPSLIIYHPVRKVGDVTVVTNGDQTDTIRDYLEKGDSFENALRSFGFVLSGNKEAYTEIAYEDDFYSHSEIICLNAIAPYVKNGSFVEFAGEDGDCWRIVFNNGQAKHINPQIVWDMPAEEIEEERC